MGMPFDRERGVELLKEIYEWNSNKLNDFFCLFWYNVCVGTCFEYWTQSHQGGSFGRRDGNIAFDIILLSAYLYYAKDTVYLGQKFAKF